MYTLSVESDAEESVMNITQEVNHIIEKSGVRHGVVTIFTAHSSAAVSIMEVNDDDFYADFLSVAAHLVPKKTKFKQEKLKKPHARIRSALLDPSVCVIVDHGRAVLGTWQGIALLDFDGPRELTIKLQIVSSQA